MRLDIDFLPEPCLILDGEGRIRAWNRALERLLGGPPPRRTLGALAARVMADLQLSLAEADAVVSVGELPRVEVDPAQFWQLYQNLLANAVKFRGLAPLRIAVGARAEPDRWTLWAQDNGRGVPAHLEADGGATFRFTLPRRESG